MASESAADDVTERRGPTKLDHVTLWERVYEHLRQEILANRLPPGTELSEVAIAESLGVSRGPVREALRRLTAEGLVMVRPRRGAVVSTLSAQEFLEAYQVREALEMLALRLAFPSLGPNEIARLEELIDEQADAVEREDADAFFEANASFHELLVASSGNGRLQELYRQLLAQMGRYRMRSLALRGTLRRSVDEHRAIVRAVKRGEVDRAVHLLSEHIRVPQTRLEVSLGEEGEEVALST